MQWLIPLISFTFVMSITPGPNNIMLWASGANYGFKRTLPHMIGITIGFGSLIFLTALGLGVIFESFPIFQTFLKIVGSLYLLYLAYRIARSSFADDQEARRPFSFLEAAGFQYANPKAWVMALTLMSTLTLPNFGLFMNAVAITIVAMLINFPCITVWVMFGTAISRFLKNPRALMGFNFVMAGLLVATILLLL